MRLTGVWSICGASPESLANKHINVTAVTVRLPRFFDSPVDVGQLISGKIAGLADLDVAQNQVFRIGIDAAARGAGWRPAQPERQPQRATDDYDRNNPGHPIALLPLGCTIDGRGFGGEEDGRARWGGSWRSSRSWVVHGPIVTRLEGGGNNSEAGGNHKKTLTSYPFDSGGHNL
ncbi:MAG: hypothetical protein ACYCPO_08090 [Acidobacteriaceae bacterium]